MQQKIITELEAKRKALLDNFRAKQPFRVSTGKKYIINGVEKGAKWYPYEIKGLDWQKWRLREILDDEVVIEFDNKNRDLTWTAINLTAINLLKAGIEFEIWDHKGKSPHLHIHNLPIEDLEPDKRRLFKKLFIRKYVPLDYLEWVDESLCGVHIVALEWCNHWKDKYDVKKLLSKFKPEDYRK